MTALSNQDHRQAYIDLMKRSLANYHYLGGEASFEEFRCVTHYDLKQGRWNIDRLAQPLTLLNKAQLDLVERAILTVEERGVPGDFIEAGVWRGGVIILMRSLIEAYGMLDRKVFAADSFAGIPMNMRNRNDPVDSWADRWVASLEEVQQSIRRFGFLDDRVVFTPGFFSESLQALAGERFAVIRLDSDSYESVLTSLEHLYPLLSKGGIIIIDDWHLVGCRTAVQNYRVQHGIHDEIQVYEANAYWVKHQDYGYPASS